MGSAWRQYWPVPSPGLGDGGTSANQQTGSHGAHCLLFWSEGVCTGVPGGGRVSACPGHPPLPSRVHWALHAPGLRAELPSWGRGSEKHSTVGSTAGEPDPQIRGRGVLLTLKPPEGRQVGVPDLRAALRQSAGGALVTQVTISSFPSGDRRAARIGPESSELLHLSQGTAGTWGHPKLHVPREHRVPLE